MIHYYNGNHRQAISYYLEALPYFTAIRDTYYIAMMHNNIGAAYEYRKEPENSISYYQSALRYFTMLQDTLWMANVLNNIGIQLWHFRIHLCWRSSIPICPNATG